MDKYKTIGSRILAGIIDTIVLVPVFLILPLVVAAKADINIFISHTLQICTGLIVAVYYIGLHAKFGQTLGKKLCHVKVVDIEENDITLQQAIFRYLPQLIQIIFLVLAFASIRSNDNPVNKLFLEQGVGIFDIVFFCWYFADIITALLTEKHRALHDFIAGTVVVKTK